MVALEKAICICLFLYSFILHWKNPNEVEELPSCTPPGWCPCGPQHRSSLGERQAGGVLILVVRTNSRLTHSHSLNTRPLTLALALKAFMWSQRGEKDESEEEDGGWRRQGSRVAPSHIHEDTGFCNFHCPTQPQSTYSFVAGGGCERTWRFDAARVACLMSCHGGGSARTHAPALAQSARSTKNQQAPGGAASKTVRSHSGRRKGKKSAENFGCSRKKSKV